LRLDLKIADFRSAMKKPASVLQPPGGQDAEQDHGWPEPVRDVPPQSSRRLLLPQTEPFRAPPRALARERSVVSSFRVAGLCLFFTFVAVSGVSAQEGPYFVTYTHYLEEPGNLEIALANTSGIPKNNNSAYNAPWLELEYGFTGWWTTEIYVEGVTTRGDGNGYTGWRWENRFRPLRGEHRINPVLYVEYEHINEASRIQKEIVGSGAIAYEPIAELGQSPARELEGKLILSSVLRGWNVSENFIFEKNLSAAEGVEFGYAAGVSRAVGVLASGANCHVCAENFVVGVEAYGGLGSTLALAKHEQRHYVAPVVAWHVTDRSTIKASVGVGLTESSDQYLVRAGWSYELPIRGRK
jgi:hypothetical protein